MPKWVKALYSPTGIIGWLILLFLPLRRAFQVGSEVDYIASSWPKVTAFLDGGLGFAVTFLVGCVVIGYAIYRSANPKSGGSDEGEANMPPPPKNRNGGASPTLIARENAQIHYHTYNIDNRVQLTVRPEDTKRPSGEMGALATLKVDPKSMALLNSFNVSSLAQLRPGRLTVTFADPVNPTTIKSYSLSASTVVSSVTSSTAEIKYDERKAGIVEVRFESTSRSE